MERLLERERDELLRLARGAVEAAARGFETPRRADVEGPLARSCGAFVTLRVDGRLRGCMGLPRTDRPLADVVLYMASAAVLRDGRFDAIRPEEIEGLSIEISVLSELVPISSPEEIVIGRDGLLVEAGDAVGLLLPQVAVRHRFSAVRFLRETCAKAGIEPDGWRRARVFRFSAEVF